jgi:hypothetical protein
MTLVKAVKVFSLVFLPLSLVKFYSGYQTYFQIFYLLLGCYSFIKFKLWSNSKLLIISIILLLNLLNSYYLFNQVPLSEYVQLGLLISLIWYIVNEYTETDFLKYSKVVSVIALVISVLNSFDLTSVYQGRELFGIKRVAGIIGEPNFSVFAMILPWIILFKNKKYNWLFICSIPLCWTLSRSVLIFLATLFLFLVIKMMLKQKSKNIFAAIFILIYLSPIIFATTYNNSIHRNRRKLVNQLSSRFYLSSYYTDIGIKNILGVGLSNGRKYYNQNGAAFKDEVRVALHKSDVESTEQHSLYSQVLSEFGFTIYFLLLILVLRFRKVLSLDSPYFLAFLTIPAFINTLNELTFFLAIAYFIKDHKNKTN